jgi:hypothetical protein
MPKTVEDYFGTEAELVERLRSQYIEYQDRHGNDFPTVWLRFGTVTREFGGPEEGGWWYNSFHEVSVVPVQSLDTLERVTLALYHVAKDLVYGDPSSVLGGEGVAMNLYDDTELREEREMDSTRPRYE